MRTWCVIAFILFDSFCCSKSLWTLPQSESLYARLCLYSLSYFNFICPTTTSHFTTVWGVWLQTWATCCNWNSFICFTGAVFELHSTAWGKPWNLLCSNKTSLGYNRAGVQRPNQQIRKKVLPPPAQVNDSFKFYQLKINCIFQYLPTLMWLTFSKRTTPEKNAFCVTVCLTCTSFLSNRVLQIKCYLELFYHQYI